MEYKATLRGESPPMRDVMDRHTVWLSAVVCLAGCHSNQGINRDIPSEREAWVNSVCTPAAPDFSTWARRQVGGVTIAVPPGYVAEQGPPTNILIRGPARRTNMIFAFHTPQEARKTFDSHYFRQRQFRNVCRTRLSGYQADVVGGYNHGQYLLVARWQEEWKGDEGKSLMATIVGPRLEEMVELRAVLHTVRPVEAGK